MNHERDQQRTSELTDPATDANRVAPGRTTQTDRLVGPGPRPSGFVQRKTADGADVDLDDSGVRATAAQGFASAGGALPHLDAIQRSFGRHDVSSAVAHVGGAASEAAGALGAHAYASGNQVAFAQAPDLFLAAHEAAHLVQQRGGVQLSSALDRPGDEHERHADAVAAAVVAGQSAESLLDRYTGGGGEPAVQRKAAPKEKAPEVDRSTVPGTANDKANKGSDAEKAAYIRAHNPRGFSITMSLPSGFDVGKGGTDEHAKQAILGGDLDGSALDSAMATIHKKERAKIEKDKLAARPDLAPTKGAKKGDPAEAKKKAELAALVDPELAKVVITLETIVATPAWFDILAKSQRINNEVFTDESKQIAKSAGSLAYLDGKLEIGKHMCYADKGGEQEIARHVNETAAAVAALLAANDPQPGDALTAKVRALSLASHAGSGGTSGHGNAKKAGYKKDDVATIVGAMKDSLTSDVKIALFACHAAGKGAKGRPNEEMASDDTLADAYRDALADAHKDDAAVVGHRTTGAAFMNSTTRYLGAGAKTGHADWNWRDIFDDAFLAGEEARLSITGAKAPDPKDRTGRRKSDVSEKRVLRNTVIMFYQRYAWSEDSSTLTTFRDACHRAFRERYPDRNALLFSSEHYTHVGADTTGSVERHDAVETNTSSAGDGSNAAKTVPDARPDKGAKVQRKAKAEAPDRSTVASVQTAEANKGSDADKAAYIRAHNPRGFVITLSIPSGYAKPEDALAAIEQGEIDGSSMTATITNVKKLVRPDVRAEVLAARPELAPKSDSDKEGKKALAAVVEPILDKRVNRATVLANDEWKTMLAKSQKNNNDVFTDESKQVAAAQGALALEDGVQIGKHMTYATKEDITRCVRTTSEAVAALLAANGKQPGDELVAKVRGLSLASHGSSDGAGGKGAAKGSKYGTGDVATIVAGIKPYLTHDVKIALFACHAGGAGKGEKRSEGTLADAYRDALAAEGFDDAAVMGHRTSGHAIMNNTTRYMGAGGTNGHADWNWHDVFDQAFLDGEVARLDLRAGVTVPPKNKIDEPRRLRNAAILFYQRYGWLEDSSTIAAFREGNRARFRERYPDRNSLIHDTQYFLNEDSDITGASLAAHANPAATNTSTHGGEAPAATKAKKGKEAKQAKEAKEAKQAKDQAKPHTPAPEKAPPGTTVKKQAPEVEPPTIVAAVRDTTPRAAHAPEASGDEAASTDLAAVTAARDHYDVTDERVKHRWFVNPDQLFILGYDDRKAVYDGLCKQCNSLSALVESEAKLRQKAAPDQVALEKLQDKIATASAAIEVSAEACRTAALAKLATYKHPDEKLARARAMPVLVETDQVSRTVTYTGDDGKKREIELDGAGANSQVKYTDGVIEGGSAKFGSDVIARGIAAATAGETDADEKARATELGTKYMAMINKHEGSSDSMNTWDVKVLSIGPGLASGGALEECLHYLHKIAPEVYAREVAGYGMGVAKIGKHAYEMTCLDTATGKLLRGMDAIGYIASQPALIAHLRRLGATAEMQEAMVQWVQNNSVAHALDWSFQIDSPDGATIAKGKHKGQPKQVSIAWQQVIAGLDHGRQMLSLGMLADKKHMSGNTKTFKSLISDRYEATLKANPELDAMHPETWAPSLRDPFIDALIAAWPAKLKHRLDTLKEKFLGEEPPAKK